MDKPGSKKKIAILTHPPVSNYGGILQAYALQEVLREMGCDTKVANIPDSTHGWKRKARRLAKYILWRLGMLPVYPPPFWRYLPNLPRFVRKHISRTEKCCLSRLGKVQDKYGFDAWVVGSDQVWNAEYAKGLAPNPGEGVASFFLESLPGEVRRRSISYAASFGHGEWRMDEAETAACKELLQDFKAVSVREESAVALCSGYLGREDAQWLPDPTFLLPKERYLDLCGGKPAGCQGGYIATYVLDRNPELDAAMEEISARLGLPLKPLMRHSATTRRDWLYAKVEDWVSTIAHAGYVVTDSFHGCAFSVIFNKPFVTTGNADRGSARFDSLAKMCRLGNRVSAGCSADALMAVLNTPVDWEQVNAARAEAAARGIDFLRRNLLS